MLRFKNLAVALLAIITISNIFIIYSLFPYYAQLKNQYNFNHLAIETTSDDIFLSPLGVTVGIKVNTEGIMVIGVGTVTDSLDFTNSPAEDLKIGDHLLFANNTKLEEKEDLIEIINNNEQINITFKRDGQILSTTLTPTKDKDGIRRLGLWVRNVAQGIGTITYYNPQSGKFGALGHGIMDADTKELMEIKDGEVSITHIESVKKGKKGNPGELVGYLDKDNILGYIKTNTNYGIFGYLNSEILQMHSPIPIARQNEITLGEATVLSNVEGPIKSYKVNIESINKHSLDNSKGMVIKIVDDYLLNKTNGIVQGMSGSPLIQNNKIIGAITHVFVQDPTKGYGVFIENMLKQEGTI